jgi:PAS domain S-box-containing protein
MKAIQRAGIPANESERLRALEEYQILDTPEEALYDDFARLAALACGTSSSMVNLLDESRQWAKAHVGIGERVTPREISFCNHVVADELTLVVPDAGLDERFRDNPLVTGEPFVRFYAGVPLRTLEGYTIGTLCVVDRQPRDLAPAQLELLQSIARTLMTALEARRTLLRVDQTERRAARREIDLLMRSIDAASDVVLIYNVDPDGVLRVSYVNDAFARQTGYAREEVVGKDLDSFRLAMPDDDGMRAIRAAIASGSAAETELISYRKDGSTFWNQSAFHPVVEEGRITHWISIERDISDEVERTSVLAEEHDRLLTLAQAARRLFTVFDARQLVVVVKDVARELLGAEVRVMACDPAGAAVEVEQLGGEVTFPDAPDPAVAQALAKGGRAVDADRTRAVLFAGHYGDGRYVLDARVPGGRAMRSTDLFMLDLIAEYFAVAARNVALYHELDERRSAVLELSQTKSDLIAMLAHDFRGPLTSIVGYADLILEVAKLEEEPREYIDAIKRAALQLSELASDTLTFSRLERNEVALQLADVDLAALVAEIVEQYGDRRHVELKVSGDTRVIGDEQRLRQVFANLIDNAIKYSPGGSSPQVTIDGESTVVTVLVQDRGIGIPPAELSTIFDRFSRASNARKLNISGTGFGLFLAKQLVQLHGGTIAVESHEGKGSTFIVTLPRRVARASAPRTVVVLDAERDASFLAYGLREGGYRVRPAATIDEVAAIADAEIIDALVVNIDPLLRDQAARLRAFAGKRGVPIVTVAGEHAARLGASATVPRPVLAGDVMAALERLT